MNAEEIKALSIEMIRGIEQAAIQRTREAIREALLTSSMCQDCRSESAEIAMTVPVKGDE